MTDQTATLRSYWMVFAALLLLTATTVVAAEAPFGHWHTPVALAIAGIKATLVVLIFMHALHSARLTWVVIAAGLFWIAILFGLIFADYVSRSWL